MRRDLRGKVVVITGAAGGLGSALARRFAAAGARLALTDLDAPALESLAEALRAAGADVLAVAGDVSDEQACRAAAAAFIERFGGIDLLINNAGISQRSAFVHTAPEVIRRVVAVNVFGTVNMTHACLPALLARRGMIVAISSVAGFSPLLARTGYAASKHALHGLLDTLRCELEADGVDVMLVCPSFIATNIDRAALGGDGGAASRLRTTAGGEASADDVAEAVLRGCCRPRPLLLHSTTSRLAWWLSRLAPRLYERIMARKLAADWAHERAASPPASSGGGG